MSNSDTFYNRAAEYQNKRRSIINAYEKTMKGLETAKGSQYYNTESEKAASTRDTALQSLRTEYRGHFASALDSMTAANSKRGITPPTQEQLSILQALKMRDNVSQKELELAASSCRNNALAISVINEIAVNNGIMRSYHTDSGEMSVNEVENTIESLRRGIDDFLQHDTTRAARLAQNYYKARFGMETDESQLAKRTPFEDKAECFNELLPFGMSEENYNGFISAVDNE